MKTHIATATASDLDRIVEIYNWAIENTTATFDTETKTVSSQQAWFDAHSDKYPILVVTQDHRIVGWGAISPWSDRCAYSGTGEVSIYIDPDFHGAGIGTQLLSQLIAIARNRGFRTLVSRITEHSEASLKLHRKLGFIDIGTMRSVGEKFGNIIDVKLMQLLF